jgi:hypothetical protein
MTMRVRVMSHLLTLSVFPRGPGHCIGAFAERRSGALPIGGHTPRGTDARQEVPMKSKVLWSAVLAIGLALVVVPLAISLPSKASAGQRMLDEFRPIMQPNQVAATAMYYNDVFTPLGRIVPMFAQMPASMQQGFGSMLQQAKVDPSVFAKIPAGLAHYKPLVTTMQANVDNYRQVDSLPSFRLFTWFFVAPGALLVLLSGFALFGGAIRFHDVRHIRPTPAH